MKKCVVKMKDLQAYYEEIEQSSKFMEDYWTPQTKKKGFGINLYLGFEEQSLRSNIISFIANSQGLNVDIKLVCSLVTIWANGNPSKKLITDIKRNLRLAQPAIDKLEPEKRQELMKLLEE